MSLHHLSKVPDGVLLTRYGEVHRNTGSRTGCGHPAPAGRVAPVSQLQAAVYQLALCTLCYPHPHSHPHNTARRATDGGGRP